MLELSHIKKLYGDTLAVDDVSLRVHDGEIFALIGPNSSGKSTLIKSIAGLIAPTEGTITIDGLDITKEPLQAKALLGYIPDEPNVWPMMTGEEFLSFTQALYSIAPSERKQKLPELLSLFSLEGLEKKSFEEYSRGNKQKFSIIAALSHKPKLLLVDEPIVGLDPSGAEIAKNLFTKHTKSGGSVLLVTHTLQVAEEIADRIGFLHEGKLEAYGTLPELRKLAGLAENSHLSEIYEALLKHKANHV